MPDACAKLMVFACWRLPPEWEVLSGEAARRGDVGGDDAIDAWKTRAVVATPSGVVPLVGAGANVTLD